MTTYRRTFTLKCGTMTKFFGSTPPTMKEVKKFKEENSPTTSEVEIVTGMREVDEDVKHQAQHTGRDKKRKRRNK